MDERKRDSMIAYLRRRMEEFDIDPEDLALAIEADQAKLNAGGYRSANGDIWDGKGDMPQWLKQAISAGQSIEHFQLAPTQNQKEQKVSIPQKQVDWLNDPFAGSPLARVVHQN